MRLITGLYTGFEKRTLLLTGFLFVLANCGASLYAQSGSEVFWDNLKKHCGKAYAGSMPSGASVKDFEGKTLVMHIKTCERDRIRIPFFVGEDRSRTWVLTKENGRIQLKHDHRHEDGTEDKITQYGGTATNEGFAHMQLFPADQETATLIDYASGNIWWITLTETEFSYNLRRIGSDRFVSVVFDLTKDVSPPKAPWGWVE